MKKREKNILEVYQSLSDTSNLKEFKLIILGLHFFTLYLSQLNISCEDKIMDLYKNNRKSITIYHMAYIKKITKLKLCNKDCDLRIRSHKFQSKTKASQ